MEAARSTEGGQAEAALRQSAATLARATAFLGAGRGGPFGARTFANGLRELDRFLNLLIDDAASRARPAGIDQAGFARQRNTPKKLRALRAALGRDSPDHERLCAIGRSRERLFHSLAPRQGRDSRQIPGWLQLTGPEQLVGGGVAAEAPEAIGGDLRRICLLYDRVAADLLAVCDSSRAED